MSRKKYGDVEITSEAHLERFLSDNPAMRDALNEAIAALLWIARNTLSANISKYIFDNARDAHRAVRHSVYQKIIGGNLNILNMKRAARQGRVRPRSHMYGNVEGPLRGRTKKTERSMSYYGTDLGYLLRFMDGGTLPRLVTNMDGNAIDTFKRGRARERRNGWHNRSKGERFKTDRIGYRGSVKKRDFFQKEGMAAIESIRLQFQMEIDKIIAKVYG